MGDQGLGEELVGRRDVASRRDEQVDYLTMVIDGAVDVAPSAGDLHVRFVKKPSSTNGVAVGSCGVDQKRGETLDPSVDCDVIYLDPTFDQQFFDVAKGEPVSEIPAHSQQDHFRRKPVASER